MGQIMKSNLSLQNQFQWMLVFYGFCHCRSSVLMNAQVQDSSICCLRNTACSSTNGVHLSHILTYPHITKIVHKFQIFGPGRNKTKTWRLHMTAEDILGKHLFIKRKHHPTHQRHVWLGDMVGKVKNKNKTTKKLPTENLSSFASLNPTRHYQQQALWADWHDFIYRCKARENRGGFDRTLFSCDEKYMRSKSTLDQCS